jgi:cytochrome c biogenesis factor
MPWLAGTALLHSQAVTEKRGSFRGWTLLLAIAAFLAVAARDFSRALRAC